jgi:hypothetical protein
VFDIPASLRILQESKTKVQQGERKRSGNDNLATGGQVFPGLSQKRTCIRKMLEHVPGNYTLKLSVQFKGLSVGNVEVTKTKTLQLLDEIGPQVNANSIWKARAQ